MAIHKLKTLIFDGTTFGSAGTTNVDYTVPVNKRALIKNYFIGYLASATVGTRTFTCQVIRSAVTQSIFTFTLTASQGTRKTMTSGGTATPPVSGSAEPNMNNMVLEAGDILRLIVGRQTSDKLDLLVSGVEYDEI